jgi:hypothetical protein
MCASVPRYTYHERKYIKGFIEYREASVKPDKYSNFSSLNQLKITFPSHTNDTERSPCITPDGAPELGLPIRHRQV